MRLKIKYLALGLSAAILFGACGGGTVGTATRPPRTTMFEDVGPGGQFLREAPTRKSDSEKDDENCKGASGAPECKTQS